MAARQSEMGIANYSVSLKIVTQPGVLWSTNGEK